MAIDAAAAKLAQQITVKGFRKGKVPKNVLMAHLGGPAALRGEAIRESIPDFYAHAVSDTLIDPDRSARHQHHLGRRRRASSSSKRTSRSDRRSRSPVSAICA